MSYIRFRKLDYVLRDDLECALFAWPVQAIPIRYWAEVPASLDLLETAALGLVQAGVHETEAIRSLLGIPASMEAMVTRTLNSARSRGYVDYEIRLTDEGRRVLLDEDARTKRFFQGWVLFDRVRGGLFPFVHTGRLAFFGFERLADYRPVAMEALLAPPSRGELLKHCEVAVAAHNRRLPLLEALDGAGADRAIDWDRELDAPTSAPADLLEVQEVEILPLELAQEHHLLIEVSGVMLPGETEPVLHSYSPFSLWEQDQYLSRLYELESTDVRSALAQLRGRAQARGRQMPWSDSAESTEALWSSLTERIHRELDTGVSLPEDVIDKLHYCEYVHGLARDAVESGVPYSRGSVVNEWGILIEYSLKVTAQEIDQCPVPSEWRQDKPRSKPDAWTRYREIVLRAGCGNHWLLLPAKLSSNLQNALVRGLPRAFGEIYSSSARDQLAKLMLASLTVSHDRLPHLVRNLALSIDQGCFPFKEVDELVDYRNDAAHGGEAINERTDAEFQDVVQRIRRVSYEFLRQVFRD